MEYVEGEDSQYIQSIDVNLAAGEVCTDITELNFTRFFWLESLTFRVQDDVLITPINNFPNLKRVVVGNEKLKSLIMGDIDNLEGEKVAIAGTSLEIKKSIHLESIYILENAFWHYQTFALGENPDENEENFPMLKSIRFGNSGESAISTSFKFSGDPFVLSNLPSLEEVIMSGQAFFSTNSVRFENLPMLKTLYFGSQAFFGSSNAELTMMNLGTEYYPVDNQKTEMTVALSAFNSQVSVYLKGNVSSSRSNL